MRQRIGDQVAGCLAQAEGIPGDHHRVGWQIKLYAGGAAGPPGLTLGLDRNAPEIDAFQRC